MRSSTIDAGGAPSHKPACVDENAAMGLINWIFDFYQHSQINRAQEDAHRLRSELQSLRTGQGGSLDAARLEHAIGELALAVKTVRQIAVDKGLCTETEFQQKLREIDARDGLQDGRSPF
jgi:hypothetical protein